MPSRSAGRALGQVASFEAGWGPVQITREQQSRRVSVQSNFADRSLSEVVGDIEDVLVEVAPHSSGYQIEFGGSYEQMIEAFMALLAAFFLAILLVYMVMASQFENFLQPLVIMVSVPLSLVGVITVLVLTGTPISAVTFVGVIMLAGIVVNNGIVLTINQQRQAGMSRREAVQRGGSVRLRAVLITSGTTITALLPMACFRQGGRADRGHGDHGGRGLAASTVLTLWCCRCCTRSRR